MSMTNDLDGLIARYEQLANGHMRHHPERGWLRHQKRRLAMRDFHIQRCGRPVDTEDEDLALLGLKLADVIKTLEAAEQAERDQRRKAWAAGASDRQYEHERAHARAAQAQRDQRRPLTVRERAQLKADGYRIDEDADNARRFDRHE